MVAQNDKWSPNTELLTSDKNFDDDFAISPTLHQSVNYNIQNEENLKEIDVPLGAKFYSRLWVESRHSRIGVLTYQINSNIYLFL